MANSHKKVILRTSADEIRPGYLPVSGLIEMTEGQRSVILLDLEGRAAPVPFELVRWIAYVRDFNLSDRDDPERLTRRKFLARPRTEGLWVRLTLSGGSTFEGLAPIDLSLADGLLDDRGIFLIPPDIRSNTQRLFIPRHSIADLQVIAVITTLSKPRTVQAEADTRQVPLFPDASRG